MINLLQYQVLKNEMDFCVYVSGDYNETDIVEVCHIDNLNLAIKAYQAYYILTGEIYNENVE